jgi:hypothetical protein
MKNLVKYLLLASFLLLTSCSLSGLLIGKLDYYITMKTAQRLDLYVKQEQQLGKDVSKLLDTLKPEAQEIQAVAQKLLTSIDHLSKPIIKTNAKKLKRAYQSAYQKIAKTLVFHLNVLTPKQQVPLLESFVSENKKLEKRIAVNKFYEKIISRFELLFGNLTPKQKFIIKKNRNAYKKWQVKRLARNKFIENQMASSFTKTTKEKFTGLKKIYEENLDATLDTLQGDHFDGIVLTYSEVILSISDKQKIVFKEKLEFIINILNKFIKNKYNE